MDKPTVREYRKLVDFFKEVNKKSEEFFQMDKDLKKDELHPGHVVSEIMREFMGIAKPRWIVGEKGSDFDGQLGFRIFGMSYWYYKWSDPTPDNKIPWREANKREFGECINSVLNPKNISSNHDE